jgi:hypothetical protein
MEKKQWRKRLYVKEGFKVCWVTRTLSEIAHAGFLLIGRYFPVKEQRSTSTRNSEQNSSFEKALLEFKDKEQQSLNSILSIVFIYGYKYWG